MIFKWKVNQTSIVLLKNLLTLSLSISIILVSRTSSTFISTVIVANLGASFLAIVALVSSLFAILALFCAGFLGTISVLVAQAIGMKQATSKQILFHGLLVATLLSCGFVFLLLSASDVLQLANTQYIDTSLLQDYSNVLAVGVLPLLWHITLQHYFIGQKKAAYVTVVTLLSLPFQAFLGYSLTFGKYGFPSLGLLGTSWALVITSWTIFIVLFVKAIFIGNGQENLLKSIIKFNREIFAKILTIGWPNSIMYTTETAAMFAFVVLISNFGADTLAAYHVTMQCASISILFALSIGHAVSVFTGEAYGARNATYIQPIIYAAIIFGLIITFPFLMGYVFFPEKIIALFAFEKLSKISNLTLQMLLIIALYQIFDCMRIIVTGALRGLQITFQPMLIVIFAFWLIGLPIGYLAVYYLMQGPLTTIFCLVLSALIATIALYVTQRKILRKMSFAIN